MRMRKKPWAKPYLEKNIDFVLINPSDNKGKWHKLLNSDTIHVEIGCGKGDYFINMAHMYPSIGWIAIEKDESAIAVACKKALLDKQDNQIMIHEDAENIAEWFNPHEIDVIHLNFSDPWPKKRNTKRRLSSTTFLKKYEDLLSEDGSIIMKTDNAKLFAFSLKEFTDNGWMIEECNLDYRSETHDEDAITEYEAKFMELNQPIYRAVFKLRK